LCLVPARGGSKRFPRKNIAALHGKPLLAYTVEAGLDSGLFDEVLVSTDDEEIAAVARRYGGTVPSLRPAEFATDAARIVHVCLHTLDLLESQGRTYDTLCVLQPTCPLRTAADIREAWTLFERTDAPFLLSVTTFEHPPFWALARDADGTLRPVYGPDALLRSQDLPDVVRPNGAIALARVDALRRERTFYGAGMVGFLMPRLRSFDIDEPDDLPLVEFVMEREDLAGRDAAR
jgi:N-acylneuraminate cytidylyltransferase